MSAYENNPFRAARFLTSAHNASQFPSDVGLEVAFAGRSNAGKSSAINIIADQKKLAKTSKTPGRTQLINYFSISDHLRLVDLPGYGYAKVPIAVKNSWEKNIDTYLRNRLSLSGIVIIMDIRHPLTDFDKQMIGWLGETNLRAHILLTKADKLRFGAAKNGLLQVRKSLKTLPNITIQLFSSKSKLGLNEARTALCEMLDLHENSDNTGY